MQYFSLSAEASERNWSDFLCVRTQTYPCGNVCVKPCAHASRQATPRGRHPRRSCPSRVWWFQRKRCGKQSLTQVVQWQNSWAQPSISQRMEQKSDLIKQLHSSMQQSSIVTILNCLWDFPGGAVNKNPPANAGDTGLSPGPGRSHMLRSN